MVQHLLLLSLIVGGITGWGLLAFILVQLVCNRQKEIKMVNDIKADLKIVQQEVKSLK